MKLKGPIVTLVAGAAVAAGLIGANLAVTGRDDTTTTVAASTTTSGTATASATTGSGTGAAGPSASTGAGVTPAVPAGTGTAATDDAVTYAGKVKGGGSLSVVVKGKSVIAYYCDGKNESWLWGALGGSEIQLSNKAGDSLTGTRGGGKITGSLSVAGVTRSFTLPKVAKPSGLYRATATVRGASIVGGWIVLPDGTQVGVLSRDGKPEPAPAIDLSTGTVTIDGTRLVANEPDPEQASTR